MIYGRFVQTVPSNNKTFQTVFDETTFSNVFSIMDESHLFADKSYISIQEKYDMLLEGVIGDIFNAIANAIKKFFEWVKNFFSGLFKKQSETSAKVKEIKEKAAKASPKSFADAVEPMKKLLNNENYAENGNIMVMMESNWVSSILTENPDLGTDFIGKMFSIISDGYKKNIKDVIPDINAEIDRIRVRIYNPEFFKFVSNNGGFTETVVDDYAKKQGLHIIEFSASDSDNTIESKLKQFKDLSKNYDATPSFNFDAVEKKISKFADDVDKVIGSLKKDFNKLIKELHPDNNKADDTDEQKELKSNYMNCLNSAKNFFKKVASEFQEGYGFFRQVDNKNDRVFLAINKIIVYDAGQKPA